ncbi:AbiV family abortive infection protein [Neobacillus drentensis]|uniref:AbiV family abortive infection protein n=1 Tax=Neobacillus drentensis TaxID=220684 RepID=UPI002FFEF32D
MENSMRYSSAQIDLARKKILDNAKQLLEEAEILYKYERYARVYTLSHLAFEELAKILILASAPGKIQKVNQYNWRLVNQELRDHISKLNSSVQFNLEHEEHFLKITGKEEMVLDEIIKKMNQLKNDSLYVSNQNRNFQKPSEIITQEIAEHMRKVVSDYFEFIEIYEETLRGNYNDEGLTEEEINELIADLDSFSFLELFEDPNEPDSVDLSSK